jgi:hypothetical protein
MREKEGQLQPKIGIKLFVRIGLIAINSHTTEWNR